MAGKMFIYSWLKFSGIPFHTMCVIVHIRKLEGGK